MAEICAYRTHDLKVEAPYFDALIDGSKPFEVRRNDRAFQPGDLLVLREWDPKGGAARRGAYSHREVRRWVTYVYAGDPRWPHALGLGVVVLGLAFACTTCGGRDSDPPCCRNPETGTSFHTRLSGVSASGDYQAGGPS